VLVVVQAATAQGKLQRATSRGRRRKRRRRRRRGPLNLLLYGDMHAE
jgi:hypothetical protein